MIHVAWRELRHHPGRYLATVLAIAISVGFMAAVSVVMATESHATTMQTAAPYASADLDVEIAPSPDGTDFSDMTVSQMEARIAQAAPGVAKVWQLDSILVILENGDLSDIANCYPNPPAELSWLSAGAAPVGQFPLHPGQVLISQSTAQVLHLQVGSTLVEGASQTTLTVAGITNEPPSRFAQQSIFVQPDTFAQITGWPGVPIGSFLVKLSPGTSPADASAAIEAGFATADFSVTVMTGAQRIAETGADLTRNIDTFKYILWVFAGVAMVVGMITISNTFAILLAQRRRQLGLLRAVGASSSQVRHSIWLEGVLLGLVGSLLGIGLAFALAAVVGLVTGSLHWGLSIPWVELAAGLAIGMAITVLAAVLPARRATSQPVLDALRPVEATVAKARFSIPRLVICAGLAGLGVAGCLLSVSHAGSYALILALAGAGLTSIGVLFGAPLFVPPLLRAIGAIVSKAGVTAQAGAKNVVRDPARSSATATAIMLAIGLVVTLQVGAASLQATVRDKIDSAYPIGLWLATSDASQAIEPSMQAQLKQVSGVTGLVVLACRQAALLPPDSDYFVALNVCAYDPGIASISVSPVDFTMPDDQILVPPSGAFGKAGTTVGLGELLDETPVALMSLNAVASNLVRDAPFVLVSPSTLARLPGPQLSSSAMMSVGDTVAAMRGLNDLLSADGTYQYGGAAGQREMIDQVVSILVDVLTALLAVAVLIALVGVGNTLTLSVIERTRESALLRALGLQRGQLRLMLLIEALILTLGSALVGVAFGVFFGYIGAHSVVGQTLADATGGLTMTLRMAVNWPQMLGLLAILVVAAGLASVLPGRRAASATPVEAMAEV